MATPTRVACRLEQVKLWGTRCCDVRRVTYGWSVINGIFWQALCSSIYMATAPDSVASFVFLCMCLLNNINLCHHGHHVTGHQFSQLPVCVTGSSARLNLSPALQQSSQASWSTCMYMGEVPCTCPYESAASWQTPLNADMYSKTRALLGGK